MRIQNWPLLLLAVEHIIKHPELHRQHDWRSRCGTYRCLAGWIAVFAGYRDVESSLGRLLGVRIAGSTSGIDVIPVEEAALTALELDPENYGADMSVADRSAEMEEFADSLFGGNLDRVDILTTIRDLAKADGVTPTPLIVEEMLHAGILSKWDTF